MTGFRVVDFSRVLAGPLATQILADEGAEVVKVEPPGGDESRAFEPVVDGVSTYFVSVNRGKRSIVLDLSTEAGRAVAARLVAQADVVVENFRAGADRRAGLVGAELVARFPRLIVVSIRAFGDDGPWAERPGYDMVLQAQGGAMSITGRPGEAPLRSGLPIADLFTGLTAALAVTAALLRRERTGVGQHVVVNMMQVASAALVYHGSRFLRSGEIEERRGNAHRGLVPYDCYPVRDGHLVVACGNDRLFAALSRTLGLPEVAGWRTNAGRVADRNAVDASITAALAAYTMGEADALLAAAGVPAAPVNDVGAALRHPAVRTHLGEGGALPGPWMVTADTRAETLPPPGLDLDRDSVLAEVGLSVEEVHTLAGAGAFGPSHR